MPPHSELHHWHTARATKSSASGGLSGLAVVAVFVASFVGMLNVDPEIVLAYVPDVPLSQTLQLVAQETSNSEAFKGSVDLAKETLDSVTQFVEENYPHIVNSFSSLGSSLSSAMSQLTISTGSGFQVAQVASSDQGARVGTFIQSLWGRLFGGNEIKVVNTLPTEEPTTTPRTVLRQSVADVNTGTSVRSPENTQVGNTTIINQPVIERIINTITGQSDGVTQSSVSEQLTALKNDLINRISSVSTPAASSVNFAAFAVAQKIDQLTGTTLTNVTVHGVSGLTDADIPNNITVSGLIADLVSGVTGILAVANGGTGVAAVASGSLLYGNGTSALATSSALSFDGTKLNATYASSTALTTSGSAYFAVTEGNIGIGTTSPYAKLSVVGPVAAEYFSATSTTATSTFSGAIMAASSLYVLQNGYVGIGTSAPTNKLSLNDTTNQLRISYDTLNFSQFSVDATGNLTFSPSGTKATLGNQDFYICQSGACPSSTATSTAGNLFVENAVTIGSGFSLREISSTELGLYNASGVLMVTFDQGI